MATKPADLARRLGNDAAFRLGNLYWIRDKNGRKVQFVPKASQRRLMTRTPRRSVNLKGRQLGITTAYCILWLDTCLFRAGIRVGIVAQTKDDAAKIFRDKIKFPYDSLPDEIRTANPLVKADTSELIFANGSSISVGVTFRSGTVQVLHVTEYGYTCQHQPQRAQEIKAGAFEAVPAEGIIVVESTAMGRAGDFFDLCQTAQKGDSAWRFVFLPWYDEPSYCTEDERPFVEHRAESEYLDKLEAQIGRTLTAGQRRWYIEKRRALGEDVYSEYPSTPDEAFHTSTEGAYYGALMLKAWQEGRVTAVPVERSLLVETWWDLGMADQTCIWFVQRNGYEIRVVDYYANSGEGLPHYAGVLEEWRNDNGAVYSRHVAPHDIRVRELNTGRTRLETAAGLGIQFEVAPSIPLADGIEAVRNALPRCVFDEERCAEGIRGLEHYRKEWNEALGVYRSQPLHDWASHAADGFRTGVVTEARQTMTTRIPARPIARERWR